MGVEETPRSSQETNPQIHIDFNEHIATEQDFEDVRNAVADKSDKFGLNYKNGAPLDKGLYTLSVADGKQITIKSLLDAVANSIYLVRGEDGKKRSLAFKQGYDATKDSSPIGKLIAAANSGDMRSSPIGKDIDRLYAEFYKNRKPEIYNSYNGTGLMEMWNKLAYINSVFKVPGAGYVTNAYIIRPVRTHDVFQDIAQPTLKELKIKKAPTNAPRLAPVPSPNLLTSNNLESAATSKKEVIQMVNGPTKGKLVNDKPFSQTDIKSILTGDKPVLIGSSVTEEPIKNATLRETTIPNMYEAAQNWMDKNGMSDLCVQIIRHCRVTNMTYNNELALVRAVAAVQQIYNEAQKSIPAAKFQETWKNTILPRLKLGSIVVSR